jgi:hypothetical protein
MQDQGALVLFTTFRPESPMQNGCLNAVMELVAEYGGPKW